MGSNELWPAGEPGIPKVRETGYGVSPEPPVSASEMGRYLQSLRKVRRGGAPRSKQRRCPCGKMTLKRAKARAHHCEKANSIQRSAVSQ